jgi:hypothetical protein
MTTEQATTLNALYARLEEAQKMQYSLWLREEQDEAAEARIERKIARLSAEIEAIEAIERSR